MMSLDVVKKRMFVAKVIYPIGINKQKYQIPIKCNILIVYIYITKNGNYKIGKF